MMRIEPSGVVMNGICDLQTDRCVATTPAPITAVWTSPGREQVNVCRPCLEEQIRAGEWEIPGAKVQQRVDLAVYSADKQRPLVVEVTHRLTGDPPTWATKIRRNLLKHAGIPNSVYFLLADLPHWLFLWRNSDDQSNSNILTASPDYVVASDFLTDYMNQLPSPKGSNDHLYREQVIAKWLTDLMESKISPAPWLLESGLYQAIQQGTVVIGGMSRG